MRVSKMLCKSRNSRSSSLYNSHKKLYKKSQIWISSILYILIVISVMVIVLEVGVPIISNLKDRAAFEDVKSSSQVLDSYIRTVASEGPGSQRIIPLEVKRGRIYSNNDKLVWELPVTSKVLEPRTRIDFGNLAFIGLPSNLTVTAYESNDSCYYIIENGVLRVNLTVFGNKTKSKENCSTFVNTSRIINSIYSIKEGKYLIGGLSFFLSNDEDTKTGQGYSELDNSGDLLGSAFVTYYVNSSNYDYSFEIGLESSADFLVTRLDDFHKKS